MKRSPNIVSDSSGAGRLKALAVLATGALTLGVFGAAASAGQEDDSAHAIRRGAVLYQLYCLTCHGEEARGDGVLAQHLKVPPANLRELSQRVGGYSEEWLAHVIDGREEIRAHGSREMPVWGVGFYDPGRSGDQREEIEGRIHDLVEYVISIQEKR